MLESLFSYFFVSVIDVPDGEDAFGWYVKWKKKRWFRKISPVTLIVFGFGVGGALVGIIMHFLTGG